MHLIPRNMILILLKKSTESFLFFELENRNRFAGNVWVYIDAEKMSMEQDINNIRVELPE